MSSPLAAALAAALTALAEVAKVAASLEGPEADPFVALTAAAALTGKSARAIRDAIRRGELAGYGRPVTVRRSDLLAWHERRRVRTRATSSDADAAYLALVGGAS